MQTKNLPMYILAALITVGFFAVLTLLIYMPVPEPNQRVLDMLLGTLATCFIAIVMYWFGSSKSSSDKTEIISRQNEKNNTP